MKSEITLSPLTLAILCQLYVTPKTGYDLKKTFEETPMGHFSTSPGSIYPAIKRMEKSGWIHGRKENMNSLRPSKLLFITELGLNTLKSYFLEPVERENVIHNMDQLLLRFAFMTPLLGRTATVKFLRQFICRLSAYLDELRETSKRYQDDPLEGRLALKHGLDCYETHLKWAEQSLTDISGDS